MKALKIRWKLTLWYGGVLSAVLVLFSISIYFVLRHQMLEPIDHGLHEELSDVLSEVGNHRNETILLEWLNRRFAHHEGFDFLITKSDGSRFFANERLIATSMQFPTAADVGSGLRYESANLAGRGRWRIVTANADGPAGRLTIQIGRSLAESDNELQALVLTLLLTGPLVLALAMSGGYFLARRALEPVHKMTQSARLITAERLDQRLQPANPHDELGELARTLNDMIERLSQSFHEMQRFTADAAHELRTPLAVLRNEAEVALRAPRSTEEYTRVLANLLEEINRLSQLAEQLLFLSRQDAGLLAQSHEVVHMGGLLREIIGNMELLAHEKQIVLTLENNDECDMRCDAGQIRRLFYNLLDNAIKYTAPSGKVTVVSRANNCTLSVTITDTGIGIPAAHLPHIFDRFYRVDPARTGETNGAGLGLAICLAIVRRLAGSITIDSTENVGTTVSLRLPVSSSVGR